MSLAIIIILDTIIVMFNIFFIYLVNKRIEEITFSYLKRKVKNITEEWRSVIANFDLSLDCLRTEVKEIIEEEVENKFLEKKLKENTNES